MITIKTLQENKKNSQPIVALTAYDALMASIFDSVGIDLLLVGDSVGNVVYGYDTTIPVTMEMMIHHTIAVKNGTKEALILADMPFSSCHESITEAVKNATQLLRAGAQGVKVEGAGEFMISVINRMVEAGIMVSGHLGFTPQQINIFGGNIIQGKTDNDANKIIQDAKRLEKAGISMLFLEMVPEELAKLITKELSIPTIGIGAGKYCDGQILVSQDMLGIFTKYKPKFVKRFANLADNIRDAVLSYKNEVSIGDFPSNEHSYIS
jgi:3-methyl-2-oxobutanoate hydroxymethyltransferase